MRRWLKGIGIALIIVLLLAGAGGFWMARAPLPATSGQLRLAGLQAPVIVSRDEYGIPHIQAQNLHDVFFAQGFVTAQDRLFQMDLSRRAASGRLSEVVGQATVGNDKFFRALGLRRAAEASLPAMSQDARSVLQWYADGVNAYIGSLTATTMPLEFRVLGYKPEPWQPVDSVVIGKYMAYDLGGNFETELFNATVVRKFGDAKARDLFPQYPQAAPTIIQPLKAVSDAEWDQFDQLASLTDPGFSRSNVGSNNWVVAGSKTASGKPLLANDPHLSIGTPAIWYQSHLYVPGKLDVIGVMFPGAPGEVIGHNDRVAWGVTNLGPDVQDLYLEKPNPANPHQFEFQGKWEDAQVIDEPIRVKGQAEPIPFQVLVTRHGPIISDVVKEAKAAKDSSYALSLKWTALGPTTELEAVLGFDTARSWADFRQALQKFEVPAQNFVVADVDGTIAYRGNGLVPIRQPGHSGLLPVPGWTGTYEWTGYIPWQELPETVNPPQGFIATANNKAVPDSYPYFLSYDWAQPYRAERITDRLKNAKGLTVQDMQSIQTDWDDMQAATILPAMLKNLPQDTAPSKVVGLLQDWVKTPVDDPNQAAPAIFHTWYIKLLHQTFDDELGPTMAVQSGPVEALDRLLVEDPKSSWFDDISKPGTLTLGRDLELSLNAAIADLTKAQGQDPAKWQWGKEHQVTFAHPLGAVKPLDLLFNIGPYPYGGDNATVGNASYSRSKPFAITHGAPWRQVVDLADLNNSFDVVTPGESGQRFSSHYADQAPLWLHNQYHPQLFDLQAIGKLSDRLVLSPAP